MGTITKIEIQKKNKQRVNLYVDEEFVCGLSVETLVKRRLKTGGTVGLDDLKDAAVEDEKNGAFHDLLKALSVKKLTVKEAEDGLAKKEYLNEAVLYAVEKGKEYGYLDDAAYAEEYLSVYGERCGKLK
ncbi:MAG: hypothetical protein LBT20_07915, partial [Clostridiales bacterium]|nr:hypothetical protein [Clostridiales bacterium]